MMKIIAALHIFNSPGILDNIDHQHLPFYIYSLAGSIGLGREQIIAGRFLSVFLGSLSMMPFYALVKNLFNKQVAWVSGILFCFCIPHFLLSVVTLNNAALDIDINIIGAQGYCVPTITDKS